MSQSSKQKRSIRPPISSSSTTPPTPKRVRETTARKKNENTPIREQKQKLPDVEDDVDRGDIQAEADNVDEVFGDTMIKSQRILRYFLQIIGRFPLTLKTKQGSVQEFVFSWRSPQFIYFATTTVIIFYILVMGCINLYLMGFDIEDESMEAKYGDRITKVIRTREVGLFHRGFLVFMVMGTNILNAAISSVIIIVRRDEFANYFAGWTRSLQTMHLDVSPGLVWNTKKIVIITCLFGLFVIIATFLKLASIINGSLLMSVMCFRLFSPLMLIPDNANNFGPGFYFYLAMGVTLTVMSIFWAKSFMLLYYIKAKTLINAIKTWNERVYLVILHNKNNELRTNEERTTYQLLFKDHCLLLDLIEGTNNLFEGIIESYFGTHIISMAFEVLFFFTVMRIGHRLDIASEYHQDDAGELVQHGQFFVRPYDIISVTIILLFNQIFYFMIILTSSDVKEELMVGLEITRHMSMIGRKADEDLFFLLSLYSSYNSYDQTQMEGGRFFSINKELVVDITTLIIYCTVIGLMFRPRFDWPRDRYIVGPFISALEGLPSCHWEVGQDNWDTCQL